VTIGDAISHFKILYKLGAGGMGEVFLAEDTKLERKVAIKFLPAEVATDPDRLERFRREAKAIAALNHPNIVTVYSVEEEEGHHFFAMEHVEGKTLTELIPKHGMKVDQIFEYAIPIAEALSAAHERGITHRDLKPGNIMITSEGRVKVLDFGLAKFHLAEQEGSIGTELSTELLTGTGRILGTMPYMSPEQLQGRAVDPRSDIFSFGTVLYTMATGGRPFSGESSADLISSILKDNPPPVTEIKGDLPRHLSRVIRHCLEKDPSHRFQTALDVRNELEELKTEVDAGEDPTSDYSLFVKPEKRPIRRWAAIGAAVIVLGLLAGLLFVKTKPPAGSEFRSLAVMPLANLTGDPELDHVADGISAGLITQLTEVAGLRVVGRSEAWRYREQNLSPRELAKELNVGSILDGELHRDQGNLRVEVGLTEASNGFLLWKDSFTGQQETLLALQHQIADTFVRFLEIPLSMADRRRLAKDPTKSRQAYEYYLRGQRHLEQLGDSQSLDFAIGAFNQAIRLDPEFALAHVGLSEALWYRYDIDREASTLAEAETAAERAAELDGDLAAAQVALARVYRSRGRYQASAEELRLALSNHPNPDDALRELAFTQERQGNLKEAERSFREAVALGEDYWANWNRLGKFYVSLGRYTDAREALERATTLAPANIYWPQENLAVLSLLEGRFDEAIQYYEQLPQPITDATTATNMGTAYYFSDRENALQESERYYALAVRLSPNDDLAHRNLADLYLRLDRPEDARRHFGAALEAVETQLEIEPESPELRMEKSHYLARLGDCSRAIVVADGLASDLPRTADNVHSMAGIYALCGEREKALDSLRDAIDLGFSPALIGQEAEFHLLSDDAEFISLTGSGSEAPPP
jgi:TolB-like protein/Flp pilus assembly protein TadD/predicted Ser/Thr protein kinase